MKETGKFDFWSIVLLGINGIVGTGIFLLPNKAYSIIGSASLGVLLFDAVIAGCIALCFAEAASLFTRNGGPYLYAKHALGDFWAFSRRSKMDRHRYCLGGYGRWLCYRIRCCSTSFKS